MTNRSIELEAALRLALEALDKYGFAPCDKEEDWQGFKRAITAIKEALAQPEREIDPSTTFDEVAKGLQVSRMAIAALDALTIEQRRSINEPLLKAQLFLKAAARVFKEALAQPEQEPVACPSGPATSADRYFYEQGYKAALRHTTPPQRNPLTMQPIIKDERGVLRFKKNGLVDALYEHGVKTGLGLNELHCMSFTDEDRQQFAQLIGYSVSGYGSLSYVTDEAYELAEQAAHGIYAPTELKE